MVDSTRQGELGGLAIGAIENRNLARVSDRTTCDQALDLADDESRFVLIVAGGVQEGRLAGLIRRPQRVRLGEPGAQDVRDRDDVSGRAKVLVQAEYSRQREVVGE